MSEKAAQLQQYNQDLVKCENFKNVYAIVSGLISQIILITSSDIDVLKRKKMKIENELATDNKNKETIVNQMRLLSEKLDEIESRQEKKRIALAKIDDTLTQSEIGKLFDLLVIVVMLNCFNSPTGYSKIIDSLQVLLNFAASKTELEEH